jgi:hypothetical protein
MNSVANAVSAETAKAITPLTKTAGSAPLGTCSPRSPTGAGHDAPTRKLVAE